jgi:hypothetical protein
MEPKGEDEVGAKASYSPAEIIDYGDLSELTELDSASLADGGGPFYS